MSRHFPDWIEAYLKYASHSEAPDPFHYWTGVSTIAGALRRRVWIDMGYFKWHPNFFIFFVAPPGIVAKSTTAGIGLDILADLPFINIGPSATSWQALVKKLSEIQEEIAYPDGTFQAQSAITIIASELGTFLDPRDRGMIDALVSLWDGKEGPWVKMTKKDGEEVVINPFINIIGCTTPSWIAENMTEYFAGGGFASRTVFVYAEKKRRLVAHPMLHMPEDSGTYRQKLVEDLEDISSLLGPLTLTKDAIDWGENWYYEHFEVDEHKHISHERFSGYLARKQTHLYKLAIIISASEGSKLDITAEHFQKAYDETTRLEHDMPKVYGSAQREKSALMASELLDYIKSNGAVGKEELYRKYFKVMSHDTFETIVDSMVKGGYVGHDNVAGTIMLTYRLKEK
jgi:hypothetical protein